ncbi:MAG TPA: PRC-barrel domain-containing protein [Ktedonobacteraceae bacterium]
MDTSSPVKKWSQLQNIKVYVSSAGKTAGTIEDFYFKPESNGVDAFQVRSRLGDLFTLPISKIQKFTDDALVIETEQMMGRRPSPYPLASSLIGNKVQDEKGNEIGTISGILLNTEPIVATRVAAFELSGNDRGKSFSADAIVHYEKNLFTLQDQFARNLK